MNDLPPSHPRSELHTFWRTFRLTAGILSGLSVFSTVGAVVPAAYVTWFVAAGLCFVGMLALPFMLFEPDKQITAGFITGVAVAVIVLSGTCFANLHTVGTIHIDG